MKNLSLVLSIVVALLLVPQAYAAAPKKNETTVKQRAKELINTERQKRQLMKEVEAQGEEEDADEEEQLSITVTNDKEAPEAKPEVAGALSGFDPEIKKKKVIALVDKTVDFFKKNNLYKALSTITHTSDFVEGELFPFVLDSKGTSLARSQDLQLLWENLYNAKDSYGLLYIQMLIEKALTGGGWVTYDWLGATKVSYVKSVEKEGKTYIIGSGYYPHSKKDAVVGLVKGAVAVFNKHMKEGAAVEEAFSSFSYPLGRFLLGDLYLYALTFDGKIIAQANRPGLIGTNSWNYKDATGKFPNQEIIRKLKDTAEGEGIWTEYFSKNAPKTTYSEKVVDTNGNYYFVACGYYADADRDAAVNLVKRGYQYMKSHGKLQTAQAFNDITRQEFLYGDLSLQVYDFKGLCIANGGDPDLVGLNQYDLKDEAGRFYVRELLDKTKKDARGWLDFKLKNSFQSIYVEKVDLGVEEFIICCGVYPVSKQETMTLLVKSAVGYFRTVDSDEAFKEFSKKDGKFVRGDLSIFALDTSGVCYVFENDYNFVWKNLMNMKDDDGKQFIKIMLNAVKQGPGRVTYKIRGALKTAYFEPIEKDGKTYVIGSGFYK